MYSLITLLTRALSTSSNFSEIARIAFPISFFVMYGNSKDDTKHGDIGNIVYNNNYLDSFISAYERK